MEKLKFQKKISKDRLLGTFSAVITQLGHSLDGGCLSREDRQEITYGLNQLRRIDSRIQGWEKKKITIHLAEFLNKEFPNYRDQTQALDVLEIATLNRFLHTPLPVINLKFAEHGVRVPIIFDAIHAEFSRNNASSTIRQTKKRTWFGVLSSELEVT